MTRNIKIDINTLLEAFDLYEQGYSFLNVMKMLSLNTNHRLLSKKYQRYKLYGVNGLLPKTKITRIRHLLNYKLLMSILKGEYRLYSWLLNTISPQIVLFEIG